MLPQYRSILSRHKKSLKGILRILPFRSRSLGISKPVFIYEPPRFTNLEDVHILYLLRGHEREYVNIHEDDTREQTSIEMIDELIHTGKIPPVLVVMPGLNSVENDIPSLGINMANPPNDKRNGLGTGQFWNFLTQELLPFIDARFLKKTEHSLRMSYGFSLGGYTTSMLFTGLPGYFNHVGLYDALFMFEDQIDPRTNKPDKIWCNSPHFDAALGKSNDRVLGNLSAWNTTELVRFSDPITLQKLKETMCWIRSSAFDDQKGNLYRNTYFISVLRNAGLEAAFNVVPFHENAEHTWHWNDRFLSFFLRNIFEN